MVLTLDTLPCTAMRYLYISKAVVQIANARAVRQDFKVLALAHLYSSMKKLKLINCDWRDMDHVLKEHKATVPLVSYSEKNNDPTALLKQYLIALGVPATAFARGKMPDPPDAPSVEKHCRRIQVNSEFSRSMLKYQNCNNAIGSDRVDLISAILRKLSGEASSTPPRGKGTVPATKAQSKFTLSQLLGSFKETFIQEEVALNFDYLGFSTFCDTLAREILKVIYPGSKPCTTWGLVYSLLDETAKCYKSYGSIQFSALALAAPILESAIKRDGSRFFNEAQHQSSRNIPKEQWPQLRAWSQPPSDPEMDGVDMRGTRITVTPSHTTIYDPLGTREGFEIAYKLGYEVLRLQEEHARAQATAGEGAVQIEE